MGGSGERVYRLLVRLLPAVLREAHGPEMARAFGEEVRRARAEDGLRGWAATWLGGVWDLIRRIVYERVRRRGRSAGGFGSNLGADVRFAARTFLRKPGITFTAVLMLSLGVAASTAVISLVDGLFFRSLPFPEADRLVYLNETAPRWNLEFTAVSYADFAVWEENAETFESMGVFAWSRQNLAAEDATERVDVTVATRGLLDALGLTPVLGRNFTAEEDAPGGPPVVLIGQDLWRNRFGGDPAVVGQTLRLDGVAHAIVGVLPPAGVFPSSSAAWVPLALDPAEEADSYSYEGVGRLRPGVTLDEARDDIERAHLAIWEERDPERVVSPVVMPLRDRLVGDMRVVAFALSVGVALVLLIACGNVASILLARSFARRRELGIRVALGAARGRIARQLFTESVALAIAAAPLGLFLGFRAVDLLAGAVAVELPRWMDFAPDWRVGLFGLALVLGTAILFGWAPILQARRDRIRDALGEGSGRAGASPGQRRTMNALVAAEVALATLLLVAGGLLVRSLDRLGEVDPGFRTTNVLNFSIAPPEAMYPDSAARAALYDELGARLSALAGVRQAGGVSCLPLAGCHNGYFFRPDGPPPGEDDPRPVVLVRMVTPGYFEAMGIRLLGGEPLPEHASYGDPVAVINESFVRQFYADVDAAIGQRITTGGSGARYRIVGVMADVKHYGLDTPMRPGVYLQSERIPPSSMSWALWTDGAPTALAGAARAVVRELDPGLALYSVRTNHEAVERSMAVRRAYSSVMAVFAAMALLLALGGIYGVLSYLVGQRGKEIGLRVALGATRPRVIALVLRAGMGMVVAGIGVGFVVALAGGRVLESILVDVSVRDPITFGAVALLLALTGFLATMVPAGRALRVEPQEALRGE